MIGPLCSVRVTDRQLRRSSKIRAWERDVSAAVNALLDTPGMRALLKRKRDEMLIFGATTLPTQEEVDAALEATR